MNKKDFIFNDIKKYVAPKKVAAIHDLSGLGRCSLTVIIPMLSYFGLQTCPLPTALLSTHTGGYTGYSFLDLTEEMKNISRHWKQLDTHFDSVYTGFLGSTSQIELVMDFCEYYKNKSGAFILTDPVMGDNGNKYDTYTDEMCNLTSNLIKNADIITPNLTEAAILAGTPYRECYTDAELYDLLAFLCSKGAKRAIITGVKKTIEEETKMGAVFLDSTTKSGGKKYEYGEYFSPYIAKAYPGTGDVFSSIILGCMLAGKPLNYSCKTAVNFLYMAVAYTDILQSPVREGLAVEALGHLIKSDNF